jgi:type I restriction enzyme S subunit
MNWPVAPLGEIAGSVDYGITASADPKPIGPKFLRITDIQDDKVDWASVPFCKADARKLSNAVLVDGDIVFARTGATTGKSFLVRNPPNSAVFASYLIRVRPSERLDSSYLSHFFRSPDYWNQVASSARGAAQPGINATVLKSLMIPVAPITEQRRIAAILDRADAIRRKREQALTLADVFLRSVFLEMFGDLSKNDCQWPRMALRNHILHSNNGLSRRRKVSENVGQIVLRIQDIKANSIDFGQPNRIALDEKEISRFELESGDVLFVRVNGNPDYVGRCTVFRGYSERVCHNDHIIRLKMDDAYNPEFLSFLFNMDMGRRLLSNAIKTSAGQYTISQDGINELRLPCPPPALQQRFQKLVSAVSSQRQQLEAAHAESTDLFAALSQRAFAGDL